MADKDKKDKGKKQGSLWGGTWGGLGYDPWASSDRVGLYNSWRKYSVLRITLDAASPVVESNYMDRAIGRMTKIKTDDKPIGVSDRDLLVDLYHLLVKDDPKVKKNVPTVRSINKTLVEWLSSMSTIQRLRLSTVDNFVASQVAAKHLWDYMHSDEAILAALKLQEEMSAQQNDNADRSNRMGRWQRMLGRGGANPDGDEEDEQQQGDGEGDNDSEGDGDEQDQPELSDEIKNQIKEALKKLLEDLYGDSTMEEIALKIQEETELADNITDTMRTWGVKPGTWEYGQVDLIVDIATNKGVGRNVKQLTDLLGRLEGIARRTLSDPVPRPFGVEMRPNLTKNPLKIMHVERMMMSKHAPPLIRVKKILKLLQSGLPGWVNFGSGHYKGHMVVAVDGSGSMDGIRDTVSKAIAIAVARAASKESDRRWRMFQFDTQVYDTITENSDWNEVVSWAANHPSGGTNFTMAMDAAIARARDMYDQGYGAADIIFISDGESSMGIRTYREWLELKKETGSRLLFMQVGSYAGVSGYMGQAIDEHVHVGTDSELIDNIEVLTERIAEFVAKTSSLNEGDGKDANDDWLKAYKGR